MIAHEIGHLLGLEHEGQGEPPFFQPNFNIDNLMSVSPNGKTTLDAAQVDTIFGSGLVQGNQAASFFIEVQPILILEEIQIATVPLPASGVLLFFSLLSVRSIGQRRLAHII
ncbi:hypothetical protein [uncultured Roseobacter sp.]|uniref:hypothetical protein n=1 Tax=uncultured Roseobacter sp. TaxID=114847 RepID=UPI00261BF4FF|nr:hypothetical protein [uncultured Roseobacter sp.]